MAITDSSRAALETRVRESVVRFLDVKPDWRPFTKHPEPGNDRAVFQYLGRNGHGDMDPWALPAQRFGLSLLYMPPGQGAPYHTHDTEEVFVVLEGALTFTWKEGDTEVDFNIGPKDMFFSPANTWRKFSNAGVEGCWLLTVLGGDMIVCAPGKDRG
jgi:mannose-6-phosphate isomerase-like protein (cupin superfamily)